MDYLAEEKGKWLIERNKLLSAKQSYRYDNDGSWYDAIDIFENIIKYRYLDPIDVVLRMNKNIGEGIFILQNQVILIEVLAAFQKGKIYNKDNSTGFYYNNASIFIDFIKETDLFKDVFEDLNLT